MYTCSDSHDYTCSLVPSVRDNIPLYIYMYILCIVPHVQEAFTCVLKGHIDLCSLVFPNKTHGTEKYLMKFYMHATI